MTPRGLSKHPPHPAAPAALGGNCGPVFLSRVTTGHVPLDGITARIWTLSCLIVFRSTGSPPPLFSLLFICEEPRCWDAWLSRGLDCPGAVGHTPLGPAVPADRWLDRQVWVGSRRQDPMGSRPLLAAGRGWLAFWMRRLPCGNIVSFCFPVFPGLIS